MNLYLDGKESQHRIASMFGFSTASVQQWIHNCESIGADVFTLKRNKKYSKELKQKVVFDYLSGCGSRQEGKPQFMAENILNREFFAEAPYLKWLTDVTEFKYYIDQEKQKVYLSAILDLYNRRIVSYVIRDSNNNTLVFDTFDQAISKNLMHIPCVIAIEDFSI